MAKASAQAQRNREIVAARAAGETIAALTSRFGLSRSRVKQILREAEPPAEVIGNPMQLALERRRQYLEVVDELRDLARRVPETQPASKVGAFKALLDGLEKLTALERATGFLPNDLGRLRSERALAETVFAVFVEHDVPVEARDALLARLAGTQEAA